MKILINKKNLIPDETYQRFRKVRAVIENELGEIAISIEGNKCIFPGGKCEANEPEIEAIQREIKEETGIELKLSDFNKVLELEAIYDDTLDYRTETIKPRHTITTYYYVKTNKNINENNMNLTQDEINDKFNISFVNKETLYKMLAEDHSNTRNGKMFDEENQIVVDNIIKNK